MDRRYILVVLVIFLYFVVPVSGSENDTVITLYGNDIYHYNQSSYPSTVILLDNATLVIDGLETKIIFNYDDRVSMDVEAYNESKIIVKDSVVPANFRLYDNSRITARNSTIFMSWWCSPGHGFHNGSGISASDYCSVEVYDSRIGGIRLYNYAQASSKNSRIDMIGGYGAVNTSHELGSCRLGRLRLHLPVGNFTGIRKNVKLNEVFDQQPGAVYRLVNTTLKYGLELHIENSIRWLDSCDFYALNLLNGTRAKVSNSTIGVVGVYDSSLEMFDCKVDYLNAMENTELKLENCQIYTLDTGYDPLIMIAKNTQIKRYYLGYNTKMTLDNSNLTILHEYYSELFITGSFNLLNKTLPPISGNPHNMRLERLYPLTITRNGKPVKDAVVTLKHEGETLDEYVSDERGEVEFNITYADIYNLGDPFDYDRGNLTNSYKLMVLSKGQNETRTIDLYTLTPLRIDFKPKTDFIMIIGIIIATSIISYLLIRYFKTIQKE